ncbi:hypothetical protein TRFO_23989 [Tritrichomonas foetus]|uniref:Uncharacterized protein n=1 Tax=Tritrichomonas foetus TaxID=1144522 RepID=A0A1J4KE28_9EUKA|nr:hypothetical protein TRFO_23989 [Tritrichomonas foetus]|eukprot:OHT07717.1 hypothetical protein TRFO_23989 [Tritrichomonas foetus]
MFWKTERSAAVLRVNYIITEKSPNQEIAFQCKYVRKTKKNESPFVKFEKQHAMIDYCFELNPKFVVRHGLWKSKTFDLVLNLRRSNSVSKLYRWKVDISPLCQRDLIEQQLRASFPDFGTLQLFITLFRGKKANIPPFSTAPFETRSKYRARAYTNPSGPVSTYEFDENEKDQRSGLLHGLYSLKNMYAADLYQENKNPRGQKAGGKESDNFYESLADLCQGMILDQPLYENGVPFFGTRVIFEFTRQPRGTSFENAVTQIYTTIEQKSQSDLASLIFALVNSVYITITLRFNGFPYTNSRHNLEKQMHALFDKALNQIKKTYFKTETISHNQLNEMNEVFDQIDGMAFSNYISGLILFAAIADMKPKLTKEYISFFDIEEMPFIDMSLCQTDAEYFLEPSQRSKTLHELIDEAPIPPITFSSIIDIKSLMQEQTQ